MIALLLANKAVVLGALLGLSELLALLPGLKSNGILDLVINLLKKAVTPPSV